MNRQFPELKTVSELWLKKWIKIVAFRQWNSIQNYNKSVISQYGQISKCRVKNKSCSIMKHLDIRTQHFKGFEECVGGLAFLLLNTFNNLDL